MGVKRKCLPARITRSKLRVIALQILLVACVLASLVIAVIVPWDLSSEAGITAVNSALVTLISGETGHVKADVAALFAPTLNLEQELKEEMFLVGLVNASDSKEVLQRLVQTGLRHFPEWNLRYACFATINGRMDCAAFSIDTHLVQLQQVIVLSNGSFTNQLQWDCSVEESGLYWNSSWPNDPVDDLGAYNATEWVFEGANYENPFGLGLYIEVTNAELMELLISFGGPIWVNDEYIGEFTFDMLVKDVSTYLKGINISDNSRVIVVDYDGSIVGSSLDQPPYRIDEEGFPQPLGIADIQDDLIRSVALSLNVSDGWYFPKQQLFSHYRVTNETTGEVSKELSVCIFPLSDASIGLNLTILVVVPESDFTDEMLKASNIAFVVGIAMLIGVPLVLGGLVFGISRAIVIASYKVMQEKESDDIQLSTGLDKALGTLQDLKAGSLSPKDAQEAIENLIKMLSNTSSREALFQPDIAQAAKQGKLDRDQEQWLRTEILGTKSPPSVSWEGTRVFSLVQLSSAMPVETCVEKISLLGTINRWDCDVTQMNKGTVLPTVTMEILRLNNLLTAFELEPTKVNAFLQELQSSYHSENFYHNQLHAADVTQAIGWLMNNIPDLLFTPLEKLALVIAAAMHDADHPGKNNQFMISTASELALIYNDSSPLENHHLYIGFSLLKKHDLLVGLAEEQKREFRKMVISLVLATDMANHFQVVSEFTAARMHGDLPSQSNELQGGNEDQRRRIMKMLMKLADVSNSARPRKIMEQWAEHVFDEFLQQGDEEKALGFQVSPHMDRKIAKLPRVESNFFKFIVVPLFSAFNEYRPLGEVMTNVNDNHAYWKAKEMSSSSVVISVNNTQTPQ